MSRHGKKYFNALKKAPKKAVSLEEAVKFVKDNAGAKFDETVDVYFHLGKELTKGDTAVRGTVKLPNGSGKTVKVAVFAGGDHAEEARQAGADYVGLADLIEKVTKEGKGKWRRKSLESSSSRFPPAPRIPRRPWVPPLVLLV